MYSTHEVMTHSKIHRVGTWDRLLYYYEEGLCFSTHCGGVFVAMALLRTDSEIMLKSSA